jgi:hypothetical protein
MIVWMESYNKLRNLGKNEDEKLDRHYKGRKNQFVPVPQGMYQYKHFILS